MRYRLPFLILLVAFSYPSFAEEYACVTKKSFNGGASSGVEAKVILKGAHISRLVVSSFNATGKEGGGYVCYFDTSEPDVNAQWKTQGHTTVVEVGSVDDKSNVQINERDTGYTINLEGLSKDYCGFGANWPTSLTIIKGRKSCLYVMPKY